MQLTLLQQQENEEKIQEITTVQLKKMLISYHVALRAEEHVLPSWFAARLETFAQKNALASAYSPMRAEVISCCCRQCLKANALALARNAALSPAALALLSRLFNCKTGHDGYYLNQGKLIPVNALAAHTIPQKQYKRS